MGQTWGSYLVFASMDHVGRYDDFVFVQRSDCQKLSVFTVWPCLSVSVFCLEVKHDWRMDSSFALCHLLTSYIIDFMKKSEDKTRNNKNLSESSAISFLGSTGLKWVRFSAFLYPPKT